MTAGLGDYFIMGDLMRKVEQLVPHSRCVIVHRANPHVGLWPGDKKATFFNAYSLRDMARLIVSLRSCRQKGAVVFGLQMAPGSWQGYALHSFLKKAGAVDHTVEFNLANADIITPAQGDYILDMHLNQIGKLLGLVIPTEMFRLDLPLQFSPASLRGNIIGVHPWSRRGGSAFTWPWGHWAIAVSSLVRAGHEILVFGHDKEFSAFKDFLARELPAEILRKVAFEPSQGVAGMVRQISSVKGLLSVNTAVVHVGYALGKKMIVLNGPTLDLWMPKSDSILALYDGEARFPGGDKAALHPDFPQVARIDPDVVCEAIKKMF